jgi:ABC-type transport system involved in multi-copper enzyme maturation permease subunit
MSNIYNIARMTYRETVRQPIFYIILAVSAVLLLISPFFCLFAFGQELSMMREVGLAAITFAGILIAIMAASQVITNEIENLTALMLLAKPVRRGEFILGKFAGILTAILAAFVFLGIVFILAYWWQEGLPAIRANLKNGKYLKDSSLISADIFRFFRNDIWLLAKGLYGCFLLVSILASFAVILSTYLPLAVSGIGCFAVLIIGNISDYLYHSLSESPSLISAGLARAISAILPHFSLLNTSSLVTAALPLSVNYLLLTSFYTLIYVSFVLYITIILFEKREIK